VAHALEINENTKGGKGKSADSGPSSDKKPNGNNDTRPGQEKTAPDDAKKG
jgi:hypothetical protein